MHRSVLALLFAAVLLLGRPPRRPGGRAAAGRLRRRAADCAEGKERTGNKHGRSGF